MWPVFISSPSPKLCAQHLDDRRLSIQASRVRQALCHVLHQNGCRHPIVYPGIQQRRTPTMKWMEASRGAWEWAFRYLEALRNEQAVRGTLRTDGWIQQDLALLPLLAQEYLRDLPGLMHPFPNDARVVFFLPGQARFIVDFRDEPSVYEAYRKLLGFLWDERRPEVPKWSVTPSPEWYRRSTANATQLELAL